MAGRSTLHRLRVSLGIRRRTARPEGTPAVMISGAARGIGRATAEAFAARGWTVGVYDLDIAATGWATAPQYVTGVLDVTKHESWDAALRTFTATTGGRLDVLVNNAGLLYGGPFSAASYERDRALVDVNVTGVLYGARAAYPLLKATPGAMLINLCSAAATYGVPDMATYSATKMAVRGITEALDLEWADDAISVRSIWPLYVPTHMLDGVHTGGTRRLGVRLQAEDVAARVVALACAPRPPAAVHHPVGTQATLMYHAAHLAPAGLSRAVTNFLVG